jgi:hypothetical protein
MMTIAEQPNNPRWWWPAVVGVSALALIAGIAIVDSLPVGVFHDDAMYVILARSLASGQGYRYLNLPDAPWATQHPPGYPALLALVSWFAPAFPGNLVAFKVLNAVLGAASAVLVTMFARARALDPAWAIALGVVSAVSIPMLLLSSMVLSEPLFFLVVIALLVASEQFAERENDEKHEHGWWRPIAIGAGIGGCALVRLNGIALLPAMILVLGFKRRWRDAAMVTLATLVTMLPWQLLIATHTGVLPGPLRGDYESASSWLMRGVHLRGADMLISTVRTIVPEAIGMFAVLFSPMRGQLAHAVTLVAIAALIAAAVIALRSRVPVTLLFLAGYLAIVAIWPFAPSRFLWAIWPMFLLLFAAGANRAWRRIGELRRASLVPVAVLASFAWVVVGYSAYELRGLRGHWWSSVSRSNAGRIAAEVTWVGANTSASELVSSEDEGAVFLYTGRRAVPSGSLAPDAYLRDVPAAERVRDGLAPILAAYPVNVVVAGSRRTAEAADLLVSSTPALLQRGVDFPGGVAYRVSARDGSTPRSSGRRM